MRAWIFAGAISVSAATAVHYKTNLYKFWRPKSNTTNTNAAINSKYGETSAAWLTRTSLLKAYCKKNKYDTTVAFMVNMKLSSAEPRFFVVNLSNANIKEEGLVTHGSGSGDGDIPTKFSNTPNSLATSLGKYKIGIKYYGQWGLAYKLHGLESTNNKAYERAVVLHGHECVPETEVDYSICLSYGCPTVNPTFLKSLSKTIDGKKRPVILWIYNK
jgi:hypothetical protein